MTGADVVVPLRVPELGPYLGKLVFGTKREPAGLTLDAVRAALVTRLFDSAGEARRLAARGDRAGTVATLGRRTWLTLWEEAVGAVADRLTARVNARLDAEAWAVRMPRRRRRRLALDPSERRAMAVRLGAAGAPLVPALDALDAAATNLRAATALEPEAFERWHAALRTAAQQLESAWLALEDAVEAEVAGWDRVAERVAEWRKPLWPVVILGAILVAVAAWLGLVLGGYLPAPAWLTRVWQAVFGV